MNLLKRTRARFRALFQKSGLDAEMDEEIRSHIELRTRANVEAGMDPEGARLAAMRQFGGTDAIKEQCRDQRGVRWIENLFQDLRFGARQLSKHPGFTLIAVLTLALGIGVNTSMFTALQAVLNRPLPYPNPGGLVQVFQTSARSPRESHHSAANFLDYRARNQVFSGMAVLNDKPFNLSEAGQPAERVRGLQVSADFFPLLGTAPALGRLFTAEEDRPGYNNVVILDHGFWQRRFGADTNIIGRVVRLDGEAITVVGVMPPSFRDAMLNGPVSLWRPIGFTTDQSQNRGMNFLKCIARLKPGVSLEQGQAGVQVLARQLADENPDNSAEGLRVVALAKSSMPPQGHLIVWSAMALAGFVMLIACTNLANLQFARTAGRAREFAVRRAVGAPRRRLLRQLVTECLLLAFVGGLAGLVLARWSNELLGRQLVFDGERVLNLPLNWRVIGFALAASTLSGLAFGLVPAWLASGADLNHALKQGSRGTSGDRSQHRLQHSLVIAEVALALVLLVGAGLMVSGLRKFSAVDPGWKVEGLTMGYLTLPASKYGSGDSQRALTDRLRENLTALPGVENVACGWVLPVRQFNVTSTFNLEGRPEAPKGHEPARYVNGVTPAYFKTLGMRLLSGREFVDTDTADRPGVLIINEAMARAFWPGASPLGHRIGGEEIVGVVSDVRFPANPAELHTPFQTYRPFAQVPGSSFVIAVRGSVPAKTLTRIVSELDPDLPVGNPGPARADVNRSLDNWALGGRLLTCFGLLGLSLATLGIYGVISGFVVRRTQEIGVRIALGAQIIEVLWLVIGKGLRLSLTGAAIGLVGAFGITRLLASALPELPANNPAVVLLLATFLLAITVVACWLPARRATRVDPLIALRSE